MQYSGGVEPLLQNVIPLVGRNPSEEMIPCSQKITFCSVALCVRQDEVVTQFDWISGPRNKMINVQAFCIHWTITIKTSAFLSVVENAAHCPQIVSFTPEQEVLQVV